MLPLVATSCLAAIRERLARLPYAALVSGLAFDGGHRFRHLRTAEPPPIAP